MSSETEPTRAPLITAVMIVIIGIFEMVVLFSGQTHG
jgi:hypothetical protein